MLIQCVANGMVWKWANEIQDQSSGSESQNRTADPVCGQSCGLTKNQSNYSTAVYKDNFGGIATGKYPVQLISWKKTIQKKKKRKEN